MFTSKTTEKLYDHSVLEKAMSVLGIIVKHSNTLFDWFAIDNIIACTLSFRKAKGRIAKVLTDFAAAVLYIKCWSYIGV